MGAGPIENDWQAEHYLPCYFLGSIVLIMPIGNKDNEEQ